METEQIIPVDLFAPMNRLITEASYNAQFALLAYSSKNAKIALELPKTERITLWPFVEADAQNSADVTRELFQKWVCNVAIRDSIETLIFVLEEIYLILSTISALPDSRWSKEKINEIVSKHEKWEFGPWQGKKRDSKLNSFREIGFPADPLSKENKVIIGFLDVRNCIAHHQSVVRNKEEIEVFWLTVESQNNEKFKLKEHQKKFKKGEFVQFSLNEVGEITTTIKYMAQYKHHPILLEWIRNRGIEILPGPPPKQDSNKVA